MFSTILKQKMRDKKVTQNELTKIINSSQQTISDYVNGKTEPDISTLIKIADFLDLSLDELTGRNTKYKSISYDKIKKIETDIDKILNIIR